MAYLYRSGLRWMNLSAYIGTLGALSPTYDPNTIVSSASSDSTGTTVAVENSTAVNGTNEGVSYVIGLATDIVPGFSPTTHDIAIAGIMVTSPPDNVAYWQAIAGTADATGSSTAMPGAGIYHPTTITRAAAFAPTDLSAVTGTAETIGGYFVMQRDGTGIARPVTVGASESAAYNNISGAPIYLRLCAGCNDATNNGPHSAKIQWWVAAVQWLSL